MNLDQVISTLLAHKGTGLWTKTCRTSGVPYDTIARIARGANKNPKVRTVEKIAAALEVHSVNPPSQEPEVAGEIQAAAPQ